MEIVFFLNIKMKVKLSPLVGTLPAKNTQLLTINAVCQTRPTIRFCRFRQNQDVIMVFESLNDVAELFRSGFPFSFLFFIPIFILISPVSPVSAAHEFAAFRMQQYDIHGSHYGITILQPFCLF